MTISSNPNPIQYQCNNDYNTSNNSEDESINESEEKSETKTLLDEIEEDGGPERIKKRQRDFLEKDMGDCLDRVKNIEKYDLTDSLIPELERPAGGGLNTFMAIDPVALLQVVKRKSLDEMRHLTKSAHILKTMLSMEQLDIALTSAHLKYDKQILIASEEFARAAGDAMKAAIQHKAIQFKKDFQGGKGVMKRVADDKKEEAKQKKDEKINEVEKNRDKKIDELNSNAEQKLKGCKDKEEAKGINKQLKQDIQQVKNEANEKVQEIKKEYKQEVKDIDTKLEKNLAEGERIEEEAENKIDEVNSDTDKKISELKKVAKKDISEYKGDKEKIKERKEQLENDIQDVKDEAIGKINEITLNKNKQLKALENGEFPSNQEITIEERLEDNDTKLDSLKQERSNQKEYIGALKDSISRNETRLQELENSEPILKGKEYKTPEKVQVMENKVNEAKTEHKEAMESLNELKTQKENGSEDASLDQRISEAEGKISTAETKVNVTTRKLNELNERPTKAEYEREMKDSHKDNINNLKKHIETEKGFLKDQEVIYEKFDKRINDLDKNNTQLHEKKKLLDEEKETKPQMKGAKEDAKETKETKKEDKKADEKEKKENQGDFVNGDPLEVEIMNNKTEMYTHYTAFIQDIMTGALKTAAAEADYQANRLDAYNKNASQTCDDASKMEQDMAKFFEDELSALKEIQQHQQQLDSQIFAGMRG